MRRFHVLAAAALLAACGEVTGSGNASGPTTSQALELTLSIQDEVESATAALSVARFGSPPAWTPPVGCPTVQGSADSDGDGILDDATLTYTAPPCDIAFRRGSLQVTGEVRITDPDLANNQSFNLDYTDLTWAYVDSTGDRDYSATRNGSRVRLGSTNAATVTTDLAIVRVRPNRANATVAVNVTGAFTAATPGTLILGQPAPSGTFTFAGGIAWHRSTENWTLSVATVVPLSYDAGCTATPKISAGQLTLAGVINNQTGTLRITWSQCGVEPTRTWIPE